MTKIKSYTDLEQSKKLAEILSIESADMFCADVFNKEKETHSYNFHILSTWGCNTFEELKDRENKFVSFTPVWSLAALLDVLPNNENISTNLSKGGYRISTLEYTNNWFVDYEDETNGLNNCVTSADNPVDACYEMILKLHELKML